MGLLAATGDRVEALARVAAWVAVNLLRFRDRVRSRFVQQ
jgi:hypothetical protein